MIDKLKPIINAPTLNKTVKENFKKVTLRSLIFPFAILLLFFVFFAFFTDGDFTNIYISHQKSLFLNLNKILSISPNLAYNITQLGDALVIFSFVFILFFITPKFWEVLLTTSLFTLIISAVLKKFFAVPRPAAVFDIDTFTIMGIPNILHTSLPSGHSMTAFMVITVLLYAFMPKKTSHKVFWSTSLISIGLIIGFSRVAIGAHYPFDVILGCTIGYIMVILSIRVNKKSNWLYWVKNKKFYPIFMLALSIWAYVVILRIIRYNLVIYYITLTILAIIFFVISFKYVKKIKA